MKRPDYSVLLKILATAAVAAVIYAVAVTVRTAVFDVDGGLTSAACFVMTMFLGYWAGGVFLSRIPIFVIKASVSKFVRFTSFMLNQRNAAYSSSAFVAWALMLIPVLATFFISIQQGIFRAVFEVLVAILVYVMALKHSQFNFSQIMTNHIAYTGFIILAICLEVLSFFNKIAYLKPLLFAFSYFFILAYLLIKNQEDIDSNIFDKKHIEKSILPRNLRRFNSLWVCVLFLTVILLFNLKPLIIFLLQLFVKISVYIVAAFLWLIGHILPQSSTTQQSGSAAESDLFGTGTELIQPLRNLISNVLRNAILLYVLYRLMLLFKKWIPGLVLKAFNLIKKLFAVKKGGNILETSDYSDETETVKPIRDSEQKRYLKKKMRKSRRTLGRISDPVEKVRYMYALILTMLPMLGVRAEQSDTTADILKKTAMAADITDDLSPLTGIYNQVRYGEKIPDGNALATAEDHFGKAVEVIGQR
jgi:hypothetical protein